MGLLGGFAGRVMRRILVEGKRRQKEGQDRVIRLKGAPMDQRAINQGIRAPKFNGYHGHAVVVSAGYSRTGFFKTF